MSRSGRGSVILDAGNDVAKGGAKRRSVQETAPIFDVEQEPEEDQYKHSLEYSKELEEQDDQDAQSLISPVHHPKNTTSPSLKDIPDYSPDAKNSPIEAFVWPTSPSPEMPSPHQGLILDCLVKRSSYGDNFGFEISGGRDAQRPLLVTDVYANGPAAKAGLRVNDVILAVDDIQALQLSHTATVNIIKAALRILLRVERSNDEDGVTYDIPDPDPDHLPIPIQPRSGARSPARSTHSPSAMSKNGNYPDNLQTNAVPGNDRPPSRRSPKNGPQLCNQDYVWIDTNRQPCSPPPEERDLMAGMATMDVMPERKASLLVTEDVHLGLLIRGGMEYGLGIYVTGLDKASAAEAANLKVGDQILSVNNHDFRSVSHTRAVRVLRSHRQMTLQVRHVGRLPYARRLSPSSTTSGQSPVPGFPTGNDVPRNSLPPSHSFPVAYDQDADHEEILRLTREASQDFLAGDIMNICGRTLDFSLVPLDENDIPHIPSDDELDWLPPVKSAVPQPSHRSVKHVHDHWLQVLESNADILMDEETQKEALLYFVREYVTGTMTIDALVLSLFHLMDSTHKLPLLDDIRNLIAAEDIARYDSLTSGMKTEWMMSPAKLFAGISQSTADLAHLASLTPPLPISAPMSTSNSSMGLKSVLKSSASGLSSSYSALQNALPLPVQPAFYTMSGMVATPSQSGAITPTLGYLNPPVPTPIPANKAFSFSTSDLSTWPVPVPIQPSSAPVTNSLNISGFSFPTVPHQGATPKFVYDAPNLDMNMFAQPQQPPMPPPVMLPSVVLAPPTPIAGMAAHSPLMNGRKSYSTDHVPFPGHQPRESTINDSFHRPRPTDRRYHSLSVGPGFEYDGYRSSPPLQDHHPRLAGPRKSDAGSVSDESHQRYSSPSGKDHQRPALRRLSAVDSRQRERSASRSHDLVEYPRSRSNSGDTLYSEYAGGRKYSYDDEAISVVDMPVRHRPGSLAVPLDANNVIGPIKGDPRTPVLIETFVVKKNAAYLGIAIEGGAETKQPLPRIINIQPKGCAHLNGNLKVGHVIITVNGKKMDGLTHAQCVNAITEIFLDKSVETMEFVVKEVATRTDRDPNT